MFERSELRTTTLEPLDLRLIEASLRTVQLGREGRLQLVDRVDSTNVRLADAARAGSAGPGSVLLAERQSAGRGRGSHCWESPAGGLYLSALLAPPLPAARLGVLPLAAAVAVCEVCEAEASLAPAIRWPNDVLVGGRKLAGILCELVQNPGERPLVVVGIGLNVELDPSDLPPPVCELATSLAHELGQASAGESMKGAAGNPAGRRRLPCRSLLAAAVLERLERATEQAAHEPAGLLASWERRWSDRGRPLRRLDLAPDSSEPQEGVALGVDDGGALLLQVAGSDAPLRVISGTLRPLTE